MADAKRAAFSQGNAALSACSGDEGQAVVEILFMAQLVRSPIEAMARRWYCKSLFRATRGKRRCEGCTAS
jgi:hypothetical protein